MTVSLTVLSGVLTPQPPLSGGLGRRCLVSLWYSGFPPDEVPALSLSKGGKGGVSPATEDSKIIRVNVLSDPD